MSVQHAEDGTRPDKEELLGCCVCRVTLSTSIEYQKEMDPAAIVEKKNEEKESEKEEQSDDNVVSTPLGVDLPKTAVDPVERSVGLLTFTLVCVEGGSFYFVVWSSTSLNTAVSIIFLVF